MEEQKNKKSIRIRDIISYIFVIALLIFAINFYKANNFNDFVKAESKLHTSEFERDAEVKYSKASSYKITNDVYNDAMFFETVQVQPNTPYKVTCMVKTKNVISKNENTDSGAHICISGTTEKSDNLQGTNDWTELTFYFNSKNRTEVNIGFRLGGYEDECTRNSVVFRF